MLEAFDTFQLAGSNCGSKDGDVVLDGPFQVDTASDALVRKTQAAYARAVDAAGTKA